MTIETLKLIESYVKGKNSDSKIERLIFCSLAEMEISITNLIRYDTTRLSRELGRNGFNLTINGKCEDITYSHYLKVVSQPVKDKKIHDIIPCFLTSYVFSENPFIHTFKYGILMIEKKEVVSSVSRSRDNTSIKRSYYEDTELELPPHDFVRFYFETFRKIPLFRNLLMNDHIFRVEYEYPAQDFTLHILRDNHYKRPANNTRENH